MHFIPFYVAWMGLAFLALVPFSAIATDANWSGVDLSTPGASQPLYIMSPSCAFCPTWKNNTINYSVDRTSYQKTDLGSKILNCSASRTSRSSTNPWFNFYIIIDASLSMQQFRNNIIAGMTALQSKFSTRNSSFWVVTVGGPPTLILGPDNRGTNLVAAVTQATDPNNVRSGHEATLEAIRIALYDDPDSTT
ncbi:hypothetical protein CAUPRSCDRAFT_11433 [Caulochytrium protostelioides]|nr:hypothetical protein CAUPRSCDRAFT_11433 [Caulochytrium protostelioides]